MTVRNNTLRLARSTQWCVLIAIFTIIWTACGTSEAQVKQPPALPERSTEAEREHELTVACLTGGGIWSRDGCRRPPENAPHAPAAPTAAPTAAAMGIALTANIATGTSAHIKI